jgi:hypothetical protein
MKINKKYLRGQAFAHGRHQRCTALHSVHAAGLATARRAIAALLPFRIGTAPPPGRR